MEIKLKSGKIIILSKEDWSELSLNLLVEMIKNQNTRVFLVQDSSPEKARILYQIIKESKDLSPEIKDEYYKAILVAASENIMTSKALSEEINKMNKKQ